MSTDAIVRERLAGGEDAFLETLFGPFLVVPKDWRKRFAAEGWWATDLARRDRSIQRHLAQEREREEKWRREEAERRWAREQDERRKYPFKSSGPYNCPRCGQLQHDPEAPKPKWGEFIKCDHCALILQFQPSGMLPYEWTPPAARNLK